MAESTGQSIGSVLMILGVIGIIVGFFGSSSSCCGLSVGALVLGAIIYAASPGRLPAPVYVPYPVYAPSQPQYAAPRPPAYPPSPPTGPFCTTCGRQASWIPQYSRWFCPFDRTYLPQGIPPPRSPPPR